MSPKELALRDVAMRRQAARWDGYNSIGNYHAGAYECDYVSPYSKSAHNVDASTFVLLQDWSSHDRLNAQLIDEDARILGLSPELPTNKTLQRLLLQHFNTELRDTYATNLFPFIKLGGLSAAIPTSALIRAAREFAIPQIEIVRPALVICLGISTFNAVRRSLALTACKNIDDALDRPIQVSESTQIWCQAHTGGLGQNNRNRGGVNRVADDWTRMRNAT